MLFRHRKFCALETVFMVPQGSGDCKIGGDLHKLKVGKLTRKEFSSDQRKESEGRYHRLRFATCSWFNWKDSFMDEKLLPYSLRYCLLYILIVIFVQNKFEPSSCVYGRYLVYTVQ